MTRHSQEVITAGKYSSSAAGAYQIMTDVWKNLTEINYRFRNKKINTMEITTMACNHRIIHVKNLSHHIIF